MLKRAKISVTRRKSKTIIFFLFLLIVANLVLSSISIKNATEESMKMARVSLGSEVILQTDMEKIRDEFMNNKDNEQYTDENKKDNQLGGCLVHGCDAPLMRLGPKSIFEPDKFKLPTDGGRHRCIGNRHVCQFQGQFRWCV